MGKSSGGIRNAGKNPRKVNVDEKYIDRIKLNYMYDSNDDLEFYTKDYEFTISSGSYGFSVRKNKKSLNRSAFPKKDYSKSEMIKIINNTIENYKNLQKVSSEKIKKPFENTPKEGNFQFENIGGIIYRRDNKTGIISKQGKAPKLKLP